MKSSAACSLAAVLLIGCGSDDDGGGTTSVAGAVVCDADEYALEGILDAESIARRGALDGHAWVQIGGQNTLDADFVDGGRLHTEWAQIIADGHVTTITASITLPPGAPRAGATLDAETGIMRKAGDEVRFELKALSEPVTCVAPPCPPMTIEGSLNGCIRWLPTG